MAGPLGPLPVSPAASTTEVEDDIVGGPPEGRCRWVSQHPPPRLKMTSLAGPLGALTAGPAVSTTEVEDDVDGEPPRGAAGGPSCIHH
jgi:hypothetical protein